MPTILNNRAIIIYFKNDFGEVNPALLLKDNAILPGHPSFSIGANGMPINNLYYNNSYIGSKGQLVDNGNGFTLGVNWEDYIILNPDIIKFNKTLDLTGKILKGLPVPTLDDHAATKKYVDDNLGGAFTPEFKQSIQLNAGALQDTWYCLTDLTGMGNVKPAYVTGGAHGIVLAQGFGDAKTGYIDGWDNTHKIAGKIDIETMGASSGIKFQFGLFRWNGTSELLYFDYPIYGYASQNAFEIQLPEYVQAITPYYFIGIKPLNENLTIDMKINASFRIYK